MRIYEPVRVEGQTQASDASALIDTGADVSLLPQALAGTIGAWPTGHEMGLRGVHGESEVHPLVIANLFFPGLGDVGAQCFFAMSRENELIIGMDILRALGISIDTATQTLSIRNEAWESLKTITTTGVIGLLVYRALRRKSEDD